jgi:DNA-directed RNA polymerase subunit RPC12/RpoP
MAEVKSVCLACAGQMEHDSDSDGLTVNCPHCEATVLLGTRPKPVPPAELKAPSKRVVEKQSSPEEQHLNKVRGRSCYDTLRGMLNFFRFLGFIIAVLIAVTGVGGLISAIITESMAGGKSIGYAYTSNLAAAFAFLLAGAALAFVTQAIYEGLILLADIADLQIRRSMKDES